MRSGSYGSFVLVLRKLVVDVLKDDCLKAGAVKPSTHDTGIYLKAVFDTSPLAEMDRKRLEIGAFMLFSTLLRKHFFGISDAVDYSTMAV